MMRLVCDGVAPSASRIAGRAIVTMNMLSEGSSEPSSRMKKARRRRAGERSTSTADGVMAAAARRSAAARQHPHQHAVAQPEMMIERGEDMQADHAEEQIGEEGVNV